MVARRRPVHRRPGHPPTRRSRPTTTRHQRRTRRTTRRVPFTMASVLNRDHTLQTIPTLTLTLTLSGIRIRTRMLTVATTATPGPVVALMMALAARQTMSTTRRRALVREVRTIASTAQVRVLRTMPMATRHQMRSTTSSAWACNCCCSGWPVSVRRSPATRLVWAQAGVPALRFDFLAARSADCTCV
jgi:hypothetical protein